FDPVREELHHQRCVPLQHWREPTYSPIRGEEKDRFQPERLNHKGIKRMVVELYDDTSRRYNAELTAAIRKAPIPIVFINCDIWQSKVSGEKFI
ncbi:unnamed protein product, partial [Ascophyllum nodosum]